MRRMITSTLPAASPFASLLEGDERLRVLVVDDTPAMLQWVKLVLEKGCDVFPAASGEAGLQAIRELSLDLVILDIKLPGIDGFTLLRALRSDPRSGTIPVIMLSADASEGARLTALEEGADDYLTKPFKPRELVARIHAHVRLLRHRRAAYLREGQLLRELGQVRQDLHSMLENTLDAVVALDCGLKILSLNRIGAKLLGTDPATGVGKHIVALVPAFHGSRFESVLNSAMALGKAQVMEHFHAGRWYSLRFYPVEHGCTIFGADITIAKTAEQELQRAHASLELRVRERTAEIRSLYQRLEEVREEERLMLAREVHDQLGQLLSAAKIDIRVLQDDVARRYPELEPGAVVAELSSAADTIDLALDTARSIAQELRPPELEENGLAPSIQVCLQAFEHRTRISCRFVDAFRSEPPAPLSRVLLRILQEALSNIANHSGATAVCVWLLQRRHCYILRVLDNGRGVARAQVESRTALGVRGMRERAYMVEGSLRIRGLRSRGTLVSVRVPLRQSSNVLKDQATCPPY